MLKIAAVRSDDESQVFFIIFKGEKKQKASSERAITINYPPPTCILFVTLLSLSLDTFICSCLSSYIQERRDKTKLHRILSVDYTEGDEYGK